MMKVNNDNVEMAYGVQESIPSIRLYDYEKVCGASPANDKDYPENFCLNEVEMGIGIKNQGAIGACVACATSTALEAVRLRTLLGMEEGEPITEDLLKEKEKDLFGNDEISEGYTYGNCRQENSTSRGMIPSLTLKFLSEKGTVPKKLFNYLNEMPSIKKIVKEYPELIDEALDYRIKTYVAMPTETNAKNKAMKDALMKYRVPLIAVANKGFGEKHCICVVGWNDVKNTWIIKNSWGETWGDNGIGQIPKSSLGTEVYLILDNEIELPFKDVNEENWFYNAVKHVYMSDIMNGRTETEFAPNEPITRAEIAMIVSRLMKKIDERFENFNKILEEKNVFDNYKM